MSLKINNNKQVNIYKKKKINIDKLVKEKHYKVLYLVGNQYCERKPNKYDKNIQLDFEPDNPYDKNAIQIISIIDDKKIKLGYVSKDYTDSIKHIINRIKIIDIIKFKNGTQHPYYHILYQIAKYPLR